MKTSIATPIGNHVMLHSTDLILHLLETLIATALPFPWVDEA